MTTTSSSSSSASHPNPGHIPIMVQEIIEHLAPQPGQNYADLTLGRASHAIAIAPLLQSAGSIIGFDLDLVNLRFSEARLQDHAEIQPSQAPKGYFHHANFAQAPDIIAREHQPIDLLLADLGFASNQIDTPERGFSFRAVGPLDMRLDPQSHLTADHIINQSSESEIADIIFQFGEEPFAKKIARTIVAKRTNHPIQNTAELAEIVRAAYGYRARQSRNHPATRTFMALRMAVNNELGNLEALSRSITSPKRAAKWLAPNAKIAFLTFHSLEDRIVKKMITRLTQDNRAKKITRKPVTATDHEVRVNPRARSAKLRVFQLTLAAPSN